MILNCVIGVIKLRGCTSRSCRAFYSNTNKAGYSPPRFMKITFRICGKFGRSAGKCFMKNKIAPLVLTNINIL